MSLIIDDEDREQRVIDLLESINTQLKILVLIFQDIHEGGITEDDINGDS